jgi:putative phosphoribosyl transferase
MDTALFQDRAEATRQLIDQIPQSDPSKTLVLGIPRGGVPMAAQLANTLHLPMDILLVRKLSPPDNPEYAIGAVSLNSAWIEEKNFLSEADLNRSIESARDVLKERNQKYRQNKEFPSLTDKTILLIDDGIATGRTLMHAIQIVRQQHPQAIWVAVPVSSKEAAKRIYPLVERFICLHQPAPFYGLSRFYRSFPEVTDDEVMRTLTSANGAYTR